MGLIISGVAKAITNVNVVCELMIILQEQCNNSQKCNDIASEIFNFAIYFGETIGPLIGGYVTFNSDFSSSCILICFLNFTLVLVFTIVNIKGIVYDLENGFDISQINGNESSTNDKKIPLKNQASKSLICNDVCDQLLLIKWSSRKNFIKLDLEN